MVHRSDRICCSSRPSLFVYEEVKQKSFSIFICVIFISMSVYFTFLDMHRLRRRHFTLMGQCILDGTSR